MCPEKVLCTGKEILDPAHPYYGGIIAHDIVEGSITRKRFVEFLHELVVCP
jgi:hypothetical protein